METDHDRIIRLEGKMEGSLEDRASIHVDLGRLQQAVWQLQQDRAVIQGGWKALTVVATAASAVGGVVGFLVEFLFHR